MIKIFFTLTLAFLALQPAHADEQNQIGFQLKYSSAYGTWSNERSNEGCDLDKSPFSRRNLQMILLSKEGTKLLYFASQHTACPSNEIKSFSGLVTLDGTTVSVENLPN